MAARRRSCFKVAPQQCDDRGRGVHGRELGFVELHAVLVLEREDDLDVLQRVPSPTRRGAVRRRSGSWACRSADRASLTSRSRSVAALTRPPPDAHRRSRRPRYRLGLDGRDGIRDGGGVARARPDIGREPFRAGALRAPTLTSNETRARAPSPRPSGAVRGSACRPRAAVRARGSSPRAPRLAVRRRGTCLRRQR